MRRENSDDADSENESFATSKIRLSSSLTESPKPRPRVRHKNRAEEIDCTPNIKLKHDNSAKFIKPKLKRGEKAEKSLEGDSDNSFATSSNLEMMDRVDVENLSSGGRNSLRRRNKKSNAKIRSYDRDKKRLTTGETMGADYFSLSLPSPGHYKSLSLNKSASAVEPDAEERSATADEEATEESATPRRFSADATLAERVLFHKNFSVLIKLGDNALKQQDGRTELQSRISESRRPMRRSSGSSSTRAMAWSSGKSMKPNKIKYSLDAMDDELMEKRCQKLHVLRDIREFKFDESRKKFDDGKEEIDDAAVIDIEFDSCKQVVNDPDDVVGDGASQKEEIFNSAFIDTQKLAVRKVHRLLNDFEQLESLFPNRKAFAANLSSEFTTDVSDRLNVLLIWYNITKGRLLEMHKAKDKSEWPNLDFETPILSRADTPEDTSKPITTPAAGQPNSSSLLSPTSTSSTQMNRSVSDLEFVTTANMYKQFVEKSLKLRGMRKALLRVGETLGSTLRRARLTLQKHHSASTFAGGSQLLCTPKIVFRPNELNAAESKPNSEMISSKRSDRRKHPASMQSTGRYGDLVSRSTNLSPGGTTSANSSVRLSTGSYVSDAARVALLRQWSTECDPDLINFGVNNESFKAMKLPSFYPSFLFLLRVPLNIVHEWLKLRIEQKSDRNPDPVTLDQLIQDCRDCLAAAVEVKSSYQEYIQATTDDGKCLEKLLIEDMKDFEEDLRQMFDHYLDYVRLWAEHQASLHQMTSDFSQSLIHRLEDAWKFAKKIAISIVSGEAEAARRFCYISNEMYEKIEEKLDELKEELNAIAFDDENSEDEKCNSQEADGGVFYPVETKKFQSGRIIRQYLHEIRERSLRALTFAKLLRHDLEITAKYELRCDQDVLLEKLLKTNHYRVQTVNFSPDFMMFCKVSVAENNEFLELLLNVTCGRDEREIPEHIAKLKGSLLLMKCGSAGCSRFSKKWRGEKTKEITPNADTNLALHNLEVDGVYLVVSSSDQLKEQRHQLKTIVGQEFIELVDEQCSCHAVIAESMQRMKRYALKLRKKIADWLVFAEDELANNLTNYDENEKQNYRDALIQAYNFAFEYHRELSKLVTGKTKEELADGIREFAHQWCRFVQHVGEKGHGARPRWASDGLSFLVFAVDPNFTRLFTDEMFADLKGSINDCIQHIIGSPPEHITSHDQLHTPEGFHRAVSWPQTKDTGGDNRQDTNNVEDHQQSNALAVPSQIVGRKPWSEPTSSVNVLSSSLSNDFCGDVGEKNDECCEIETKDNCKDDLHVRIMENLRSLEICREIKLRDDRRIGRCLERREIRPHTQIIAKRANFKWQRLSTKIGAGNYGSVYTAINLDTGQLMAMKQIKFQLQDHQAMQALVDEVTNFEGIQHVNLVRYFGVEVHRDELCIFMEFCNEGTLEKLCLEGLSEEIVRTYTLHLLTGLCELHRRGIVHRDIKTANIFLTDEYQTLKLGDFGSSVRLKETTTLVGELTLYVGTPAYMAPEVCTSSADGYGRAADIWSVGCVVLEMATGKPPWHELTNKFAIIWKVGNGAVPSVADTLSVDCKDFLSRCLRTKPVERWTAEQLLEHPFVKVAD